MTTGISKKRRMANFLIINQSLDSRSGLILSVVECINLVFLRHYALYWIKYRESKK